MNKNQSSHANAGAEIVLICGNCNQKLRVPRRRKKLHVTCPTCRYEFDHPEGDEFHLITPTELKGLILSSMMIIFGFGAGWVNDILPRPARPDILVSLSVCLIPIGAILFIVFGILALIARKDITRFGKIEKIVVSRAGITLYRKDASPDLVIYWRQVKTIKILGLKHLFWALIEIKREPTAIIFKLVDDSSFTIPLLLILKEKDRYRMVSTISRYVPFENAMA